MKIEFAFPRRRRSTGVVGRSLVQDIAWPTNPDIIQSNHRYSASVRSSSGVSVPIHEETLNHDNADVDREECKTLNYKHRFNRSYYWINASLHFVRSHNSQADIAFAVSFAIALLTALLFPRQVSISNHQRDRNMLSLMAKSEVEITAPRLLRKASSDTNDSERKRKTAHFVSFDVPFRIDRHWIYDNHGVSRLSSIVRNAQPDFGDLVLESRRWVEPDQFARVLRPSYDDTLLGQQRLAILIKTDSLLMERFAYWDELQYPRSCVKPRWSYAYYPVCNPFHELPNEATIAQTSTPYNVDYLAHGHYRDAFLYKDKSGSARSPDDVRDFVIKRYRAHKSVDRRALYMVQSEAMIMERLSASSRISDIYGHCAASMLVQSGQELTYRMVPRLNDTQHVVYRGKISQADLDMLESQSPDGVYPMNNLTAEEKLDIATAIAESLAELHGFSGGALVNDDIFPDQWLITENGQVILNDLNNAKALEWNAEQNSYCPYLIGFGGTFKSPEEYGGGWVDESVDVWPMGNLIFALLTGLFPYYDEMSETKIQNITKQGIVPYLNPAYATRSLIEGRLVEVMRQCHRLNPKERVDIFAVVRHLRETARMYEYQQQQRKRQ